MTPMPEIQATSRPNGADPAADAGRDFQTVLGYTFRDPALLQLALTHRSARLGEGEDHNEKLEFLGDAVLGLVMSDLLYRRFPAYREGELSKMRASLVNAQVLTAKARGLDLGDRLRIGPGEEHSGGRAKSSILAAAYEAVLGAVYLDGGFAPVTRLVAAHFAADLQETARIDTFDSKTRLQEITQKIFKATPDYQVVEAHGPNHDQRFVSRVSIAGTEYGSGHGRTKKQAQQAAAAETLELLQRESLAAADDA